MTLAISRHTPAQVLQTFFSALRNDAPFYLFIGGFTAVVAQIAIRIGAQQKMVSPLVFFGAAQAVFFGVLIAVIGTAVWALKSRTPLQAWQAHMLAVSDALASMVLFVSLGLFLCVFSSMKQMLTELIPFHADPMLADLDAFMHGGDPWQWTNAAMPLQLVWILEKLYYACWGAVVIITTIAALFYSKLRHLRSRYVWAFLIMWTVLGNIFAGAFMSAGPVFYEHVTGDAARFSALTNFLAAHTEQKWIHDLLWRSYSGQVPGVTGAGISAFPSLHVASTTLCAMVAWHAGRCIRGAAFAFAAVIMFGSIQLGWHYAVDGYFSVLITLAIWKGLGAIERKRRSRFEMTHGEQAG